VPYVWLSDCTLLDVSAEDLPVLPTDIAALLESALAPFGYIEPPAPRATGTGAGGSIWSEINDEALRRLSDWVPHLGLPKTTARRDGGYSAVAAWRPSSTGRPMHLRNPNLSFSRQGIKDFGAGGRNTYSPIDAIAAALGMEQSDALQWLAERIGFYPPDDGFDVDAFIARVEAKKQKAGCGQ
jgi:hypothetical protein